MIIDDSHNWIPVPLWVFVASNFLLVVADQRAGINVSDMCAIIMVFFAYAKNQKQIHSAAGKVWGGIRDAGKILARLFKR
jgi:hypothetical protein